MSGVDLPVGPLCRTLRVGLVGTHHPTIFCAQKLRVPLVSRLPELMCSSLSRARECAGGGCLMLIGISLVSWAHFVQGCVYTFVCRCAHMEARG